VRGRAGIKRLNLFSVEREGKVGAGDTIEPVHREIHDVTVVDVVRALSSRRNDAALLRRVAAVDSLPPAWKEKIQERLARPAAE
jgi:MOSC domain-containing protein YiiM